MCKTVIPPPPVLERQACEPTASAFVEALMVESKLERSERSERSERLGRLEGLEILEWLAWLDHVGSSSFDQPDGSE